MSESINAEIAYKCDLCGQLFNSPANAQNHQIEAHTASIRKEEAASRVVGTSTPAEDREEERTAKSVT